MEENNNLEQNNAAEEAVHNGIPFEHQKRMKNLVSIVILLAGLFVGSLFVDIGQLVRSAGYSQKNLNKSDIFVADNKTWVAYNESPVGLAVIGDDACEQCDPADVLVWMRRVLPTISTKKIDYSGAEGQEMISKFGIKTLPAFIFEKNLEDTELYAQAKEAFLEKEGKYVLDTQLLGVPVGRYLTLPEVNGDDATFGPSDAQIKVVVYSDFQCPYCKVFYSGLRSVMKDEKYSDKVLFDFKELSLSIHEQSNGSANASRCALEQGKFWEYADMLYAKQSDWGNSDSVSKFKSYAASLGLDKGKFNACLDAKKYQDKIDANVAEAQDFGISATPTIFIGDKVETGALPADQLKKDIDEQLNR